ncbi:hypothetical protein [Flavobacterium sp. PS2]|uniref:hypothetical protein n=1 Tax=Flavobacterium sp. PS2 TaxID=3384157 RepID=UPI00390C4C97
MKEIACIIECEVVYNDNRTEIRRPTLHELSLGFTSINTNSVVEYLKVNLDNVKSVKVLDILYFTTRDEYLKYIQ